MATQNFFALLGDDENDDPSALIARVGAAAPAPVKDLKKQQQAVAKLPTKPAPPAQAVREAQADGGRGRGGRGGRGSYGNRDRNFEGGYNRPTQEGGFQGGEQNDRSFNNYRDGGGRGGYMYMGGNAPLNGDSPATGEKSGRQNDGGGRGHGRGRGRGRGYGYMADGEEHSGHREYDRRSGTGRGLRNEVKRDGAGRGNWGAEMDQHGVQDIAEVGVAEEEKPASSEVIEKKPEKAQLESEDREKKNETEEEEKEMTLEEYEKLLGEKRKPLEALKAKERKVKVDKDFESMQLVDKKNDEEVFLKLGADKGKKKEVAEKDEKARKPLSINEFLKPADGEGYVSPSGRRGRGGRGRGERGGGRGGYSNSREAATAPRIEDPSQFPTLGGK